MSLDDHFKDIDARRDRDLAEFETHDQELCMLCHARGCDMRSLFVGCLYDVKEVVPVFLDLTKLKDKLGRAPFYARICKTCRSRFLTMLSHWADECAKFRSVDKDSDGVPYDDNPERNIPMRVNGATVMMTRAEYEDYERSRGREPRDQSDLSLIINKRDIE